MFGLGQIEEDGAAIADDFGLAMTDQESRVFVDTQPVPQAVVLCDG